MKETNYVRCGSHCKHPAYTKEEVYSKEEIDNKFSTTQSQTVTIVKSESGTSDDIFLYPDGFNKDNTIIIGCFLDYLADGRIFTIESSEFQNDYFLINGRPSGSVDGNAIYAMIVKSD